MADELVRPALQCAVLAFVLVWMVRQLALRHGVLDHPTERSSHVTATPRGGGLGVVLAVIALAAWRLPNGVELDVVLLLLGAAAVATVGWLDDRRGLGVWTRLAVHVASGVLVGLVAASQDVSTVTRVLLFAWWTFWTVSSVNLVNFMDGINGLVASQIAIFACSLAAASGTGTAVHMLAVLLAAACVGFLPWNFPRARIFLGDVGSGALGFLVPALAMLAQRDGDVGLVQAHLPLLPLYGDATWTIARRWRNGERVTTAHRSHLYQRLAHSGLGHSAVTLIYAVAAILGALAAHLGPPTWMSPWTAGYALAVLAVGFTLHRHVVRASARAA